MEVAPEFLIQQMEAVFTDIYPDAVKIGMVASAEQICAIAEVLRKYQAKNVVLDPVMERELFPMAALITPNIPEAEVICRRKIADTAAMERAAAEMGEKYGCAVLLKGGHAAGGADDVLWQPKKPEGVIRWYAGRRIDNPNTHGTGCTLSSAIASNLAKGLPLDAAVAQAKEYLSGAIAAMLKLGKGSGPLDHGYKLNE